MELLTFQLVEKFYNNYHIKNVKQERQKRW